MLYTALIHPITSWNLDIPVKCRCSRSTGITGKKIQVQTSVYLEWQVLFSKLQMPLLGLTWKNRLCFWRNISSIYTRSSNKSTSVLWTYQTRRGVCCPGCRRCSDRCSSCPYSVGFQWYISLDAWRTQLQLSYGPAPQNSDSAVNILLDVVQDQSGKTYKMDHYATRYPTNVVDVANFLVRLTGNLLYSYFAAQ